MQDSDNNNLKEVLKKVTPKSDWTKYTFTFEPTKETRTASIRLRIRRPGQEPSDGPISFDDMRLEEVENNLVPNPGFETGASSPDAWWIQGSAKWQWDQDEMHSGQYSLALFPSDKDPYITGANSLHGISVSSGKTYRVRIWAKNDSTDGGSVGVRFENANRGKLKEIMKDVTPDSDWTKYTFTFQPTTETKFVSIRLRNRVPGREMPDGTVWFDDIKLAELFDEGDS